jgi:uncharacterized protein YbjQ (UPF0145 family)
MSTPPTPLGGVQNEEADLRDLGRALAEAEQAPVLDARVTTSDLSLDEILLLHSVGLEPAEVVFGVGCVSILTGVWTWAVGAVDDARVAFHAALNLAKENIRSQVHRTGALGVVGVEVEVDMRPHACTVVITGTAVRAMSDEASHSHFRVKYHNAFLCDLSARDFVVLGNAGWYPLDLVAGASFVHAPRRSLGTAVGQATQNIELTNFTETLYAAREQAMGELQSRISQAGGTGLLDAKIVDRPMRFASHVVEFVVYGTAVRMLTAEHTHPQVSMVVPLDDAVRTFEATSLD